MAGKEEQCENVMGGNKRNDAITNQKYFIIKMNECNYGFK